MVRIQSQRKGQLGRPTKFLRKQGGGDFQPVPPERLADYTRRLRVPPQSPSLSGSSGQCSIQPTDTSPHVNLTKEQDLPSNIECYTPPSISAPNPPRTPSPLPTSEPDLPPASAVLLARDYAMDAKYQEARDQFMSLSDMTRLRWGSILFKFNADIMEVARHPGCPQTLAARVVDTLSRYLFDEKEHYRNATPTNNGEGELRKLLSGLRLNARFWGSVVIQQRGIQIWEPVLGSDHPKVVLLRKGLAIRRGGKIVNMDSDHRLIESEDSLRVPLEVDQLPPSLGPAGDLLHLGEGSPANLLAKLQAFETSPAARADLSQLRFGRSRALVGVYYSFMGRYWDAEVAFQDSEKSIQHETCVEIELHRILWYAEHKSRIWEFDGAWGLLCRAHQVFLSAEAPEEPAELFVDYFMDRFSFLGAAVLQRISIDKVRRPAGTDGHAREDCHQPSSTVNFFSTAPPLSSLAMDRLFSFASRGNETTIDIDAWREFVHFSTDSTTP